MSNATSNILEDENDHLASDHGLIKTTAYVRGNSAKQRSSGAKRVARHRQQKKEKGLVPVDIPGAVAEEIKAAGSFDIWVMQFQRTTPEKTKMISESIRMFYRVNRLHPWVRWLLNL